MKKVCNGCVVAATMRGILDCPFCRAPTLKDDALAIAMLQKRVDAKDPDAIEFLGQQYHFGKSVLKKNVPRAFELYKEAAELGSSEAHFRLSNFYLGEKEGIVTQDDVLSLDYAKALRHWEEAACGGHVGSRYMLGLHEFNYYGNYERAVRHFLISAKMGDKDSLDKIRDMVAKRGASKEQYADALKGYQDSVEEMTSPERVDAYEKAAIHGHVKSRFNLGVHELNKGNYERAVRHFLISAKMGDKDSLDNIKDMLAKGRASKEQYADALKGYQDSVEEMATREG